MDALTIIVLVVLAGFLIPVLLIVCPILWLLIKPLGQLIWEILKLIGRGFAFVGRGIGRFFSWLFGPHERKRRSRREDKQAKARLAASLAKYTDEPLDIDGLGGEV